MLDAGQFILRSMVDAGRISPEDIERAGEQAAASGLDVTDALVQINATTHRELAIEHALICEYPFVELDAFQVDIRNCRRVPQRIAEELCVFPLFVLGDVATVAMADPLDLASIDRLTQALNCRIDPVVCDVERLRALIARAYSLALSDNSDIVDVENNELTSGAEPIVVAVNQIMYAAADAGASDVHISPDERRLHLRFRVDGVLQPQQGPDISMHQGMVQRLKVMAHLDLTQSRRPQDGKFRFSFRGQDIDVRLSVLPTIYGENIVMRLLRPAGQIGAISELGMAPAATDHFEQMITKPHGIILVTGPTGSGKTTTLYTALSHINTPDLNIMTIEDPVEIRLPMIRQVQANAAVGLTFASALRSILRQDPDVVLVGEIRDEETAKIAVQAALTGHLVLSTLHTNDAVGSLARLRDFGIASFAINNALLGVIAQRLVRRVCDSCVRPNTPSDTDLALLGLTPRSGDTFVKGRGCAKCLNTGYKGRMGVYEMFRVTPSMHRLIERDADATEIEHAARRLGMQTMLEDGIEKARRGLTSIEELGKLNATLSEDPVEEPAETPVEAPVVDEDPGDADTAIAA
ncbi:MAG: general secretion pathway protein GspE [Phycisphaeraceae bacterium]|nr:MAG: general secretion pathway protein GspE [Phycisphaeraceae bacterium]